MTDDNTQEMFPTMNDALDFARSLIKDAHPMYPHDGNLSIIIGSNKNNEQTFYVESGCPFIRTWECLAWEWNEELGETLHYDARVKPKLKSVWTAPPEFKLT